MSSEKKEKKQHKMNFNIKEKLKNMVTDKTLKEKIERVIKEFTKKRNQKIFRKIKSLPNKAERSQEIPEKK